MSYRRYFEWRCDGPSEHVACGTRLRVEKEDREAAWSQAHKAGWRRHSRYNPDAHTMGMRELCPECATAVMGSLVAATGIRMLQVL